VDAGVRDGRPLSIHGEAMPLLRLFLDGAQKGEAVNNGVRRRNATNERVTRQRLKWMLETLRMHCEWWNADGSVPKRRWVS
jgi:hypothetical protein